MPRMITIDSVEVTRIQLFKTSTGEIQVYAEYRLKSGSQTVQTAHRDFSTLLSATRKTNALAIFDALAQEMNAIELA